MTHADLVARAVRWLRNTRGCGVVLDEWVSRSPETPDAIGWAEGGRESHLVECKTSLSDFYADARKPGRRGAGGLGRYRWYLTPPKLLTADRVRKNRPRWGLLEALPHSIRVVLRAEPYSMETAWRDIMPLYSFARAFSSPTIGAHEAADILWRARSSRVPVGQ